MAMNFLAFNNRFFDTSRNLNRNPGSLPTGHTWYSEKCTPWAIPLCPAAKNSIHSGPSKQTGSFLDRSNGLEAERFEFRLGPLLPRKLCGIATMHPPLLLLPAAEETSVPDTQLPRSLL